VGAAYAAGDEQSRDKRQDQGLHGMFFLVEVSQFG